jgi:hypothetical protein
MSSNAIKLYDLTPAVFLFGVAAEYERDITYGLLPFAGLFDLALILL